MRGSRGTASGSGQRLRQRSRASKTQPSRTWAGGGATRTSDTSGGTGRTSPGWQKNWLGKNPTQAKGVLPLVLLDHSQSRVFMHSVFVVFSSLLMGIVELV